MIRVKVNGQNREFVQPMGLMEFLSANGLDIRFIAVAHNGEVVDKKDFQGVLLQNGDNLEVVRPVGGG